jgi:hypothetical protein
MTVVMASLWPLHVPLKGRRCRHGAVAIPIVAVDALVAENLFEQRTHPQHLDIADNQVVVSWCGRRSTPSVTGSR